MCPAHIYSNDFFFKYASTSKSGKKNLISCRAFLSESVVTGFVGKIILKLEGATYLNHGMNYEYL